MSPKAKKTVATKKTNKKSTAKKATKVTTKKTTKKAAKKPKLSVKELEALKREATRKRNANIASAKKKAASRAAKNLSQLPKLRKVKTRLGVSVKVRKIRNKDVVLILDFGSQYTQLIARRIRESKVFSKIIPYNASIEEIQELNPKGIILSGGPLSVYDENAPRPDEKIFDLGIPILGICYGMQVITEMMGGKVEKSKEREFGRAELFIDNSQDLFTNLPTNLTCWMSHSDSIKKLPSQFSTLAHTLNAPNAAIANRRKKIFGVQFHPEVVHTQRGNEVLNNFVFAICGCLPRWTMGKFIDAQVKKIQEQVGNKKVVLGLSGGVDSSVAAALIHKAVKNRLQCIFVDNGLLRNKEVDVVQKTFKTNFKMNLTVLKSEKSFLKRLEGIEDPEEKRKIIGDEFGQVFMDKAKKVKNVSFLAQGTLYPDVIESVSAHGGPTAVIKSHHNVGGLPKNLDLELIEPFRELFKDEVREIGKHLGVPDAILKRQPFPGPGLAIRIIGEVTKERLEVLRAADEKVLEEIKRAGLYNQIWQAFAVLLPVKTVGVMGDQRTYENVIAVRCVSSVDGMTADWVDLPHEVLAKISNRIINEVEGVNRVVYDVSSKPPATIEWE